MATTQPARAPPLPYATIAMLVPPGGPAPRHTIVWLAVLGAPVLLGYGLAGTSKMAF